MYEKTFRATGINEAGNGKWSVHFREVVAEGQTSQDSLTLTTTSLQEALDMRGNDQVITIAPAS